MKRRYIILIISVLIIGAVAYYFGDIVGYIIGGWVLSLIGLPIKKTMMNRLGFHRLKWGNVFASILTLLLLLCILVLVFIIVIPLISRQIQLVANVDYQAFAVALQEPLSRVENYLKNLGVIQDSFSLIEEFFVQVQKLLVPTQISQFFTGVINTVASIGIAVGSILFIAFFFIKDQSLFNNAIKSFLPDKYEGQMTTALNSISTLLSRYFGGLAIQSITFFIVSSTALSIMGFENALLMGFFGGLFNIIPYLGPWIAGGFGVLIAVTSNLDSDFATGIFPKIIQVVIVFSGAQIIDNFLVSPFVFSNRVVAHPLEIFIVTLLGSKLGGLFGMVVAIPAYTVLRVLAGVFLSEFKVVQKITAGLKQAMTPVEEPPPDNTIQDDLDEEETEHAPGA